ncbi:ribokinase [Clostridium amazonitimonense]|uniref:ribokinase n=1 Tax=Clostridium amazonitimonense TaxID=1499689 RepID=UPI00068B5D45|nr:ribokinase [Clostridium amazonitimonense]
MFRKKEAIDSMKKVIVVGSLNMDLTIKVDNIPSKGETIQGHDFLLNAGGKGGNQAIAAVKSKAEVLFIGSVGKDPFGTEILSSLKNNGINTDYIDIQSTEPTGIAMIVCHESDNRIIINPGANNSLSFDFAKEKLFELAKEEDIFVTQFENDLSTTLKLIEYAKSIGMTTLLNPAPAKLFSSEYYKYIDILVINQSECEMLTNIYPRSTEECEKAANILKEKGAKNIVITLGRHGSVTITPDETIKISAHKVDAIDSTAAGDSFIGALSAQLSFGNSLKEALIYATKVSAITVTREGAQISIPTLEQVNEFFKSKKEE